jgi:hypothetical protein
MGVAGLLECSAGCGWLGSGIQAGEGMTSVRGVRRCAACGDITDVLVARMEEGRFVEASGRGRCRACGSQRLRAAPDVDALLEGDDDAVAPCPACAAPLVWQPTAIWD